MEGRANEAAAIKAELQSITSRKACIHETADNNDINFEDPSVCGHLTQIRLAMSSGQKTFSANDACSVPDSLDKLEITAEWFSSISALRLPLKADRPSGIGLQQDFADPCEGTSPPRSSLDLSRRSRVAGKPESCIVALEDVDDSEQRVRQVAQHVSSATAKTTVDASGRAQELAPPPPYYQLVQCKVVDSVHVPDQSSASSLGFSKEPSVCARQSSPPPEYNTLTMEFLRDEPPRYQDIVHVKPRLLAEKIRNPKRSKSNVRSKIAASVVGLTLSGLVAFVIYISERYK